MAPRPSPWNSSLALLAPAWLETSTSAQAVPSG